MKKQILSLSVLALTMGAMNAAEPAVYPGLGFCGVAPDASLAISYIYGETTILDVATGVKYGYTEDENISLGNGNNMSNTGVVVGSIESAASYWKDGEWTLIEPTETRNMSYANGITRDGSRIVGTVSPDNYDGSYESLMLVPCYWDLQSDGTYGKINLLPHPEKDFAGRTPQYITALSVSQDGNTIIGQVQDYSGFVIQPIVYKYNDGKWSYTLLMDKLYHPEGFVLPEDPGDSPNVQPETFMSQEELAAYEKAMQDYWDIQESLIYPEMTSYMSDEEYQDYIAALEAFYETWEGEFPEPQNYMTQEEWDAYQQAVEEYEEAVNNNIYPDYVDYMTEAELAAYEQAMKDYDIWDEKWMEFSSAFQELCDIVPNFTFNNVLITPDGTKYATTFAKGDFFTGYEYVPYLINLEDNIIKAYEDYPYVISSMTDDGTLLAQAPGSWENPITMAYVLPSGAENFEPLHSFIASKNETIGAWMTENMTHETTDYILNEDTWEYEEVTTEVLATGIPFASADMSVIALTVENFWFDWESGEEYIPVYGYLLESNAWAGVKANLTGTADVKAYKGGLLVFSGDVASAAVYDLAGHLVYSVDAPAATVSTGLTKGIYVVKAVAADGTATVRKVAF